MSNFLRLLVLCRPHYKAMLLGVFLTTLTVLANIGLLAVSGWFLASMAAAGIASATMNYFTPAGIIRFLAIVRTTSRYGERLVTHNATFLLLSQVRVRVFATLSQLNNQDLAMNRSADLVNRIQNDVDALDKFYLNVLLPILVALVCVPIVIGVMASYNAQVALICLLGIVLLGVCLPAMVSFRLRCTGEQQTKRSAQLREALSDIIAGQRELAMYQATDAQLRQCERIQQHYNGLLDERHKAVADSDGLSLLVVQLAMLGAVIVMVPLVSSGQMINVNLAMLSLFVLASFESVALLPNAVIQLPVALSAAARIFALDDKLAPGGNNVNLAVQNGDDLTDTALGLVVQGVSYRYASHFGVSDISVKTTELAPTYALDDLSFSLNPHEKVALVGPSGSGKSTLVNVLSGLWPQQAGKIAFSTAHHEVPLKELTFEKRTQLLAILAQQHHIFDGTIADNLHYAAPKASNEQMEAACEQAQLGEWLTGLPNGLNTRLGSAGRRVSQGQSRRLAIAQILLRKPAILVLDEPTEGLDNQSKQAVMKAMSRLTENSAMLVITHDAGLLSQMDNVIWLENGKVRGQGRHQALLAAHEDYRVLTTRF